MGTSFGDLHGRADDALNPWLKESQVTHRLANLELMATALWRLCALIRGEDRS